jgi:hypothetical protein
MRFSAAVGVFFASSAFAGVVKRQTPFSDGQPIDGKGKGAPILGRSKCLRDILIASTDSNRWNQSSGGHRESFELGPAEHRFWHRAEPQVALFRLEDSNLPRWMGA